MFDNTAARRNADQADTSASAGSSPGKRTLTQNLDAGRSAPPAAGNGAAQGVQPAQGSEYADVPYSPAWFQAHPDALPAGVPPEVAFHEFVARELAYKSYFVDQSLYQSGTTFVPASMGDHESNYTAQERRLLESWGYNPMPSREIHDPDSGLYMAVIESADGSRPPIVACRGSEMGGPDEHGNVTAIDWISDLDPRGVGYGQFHDNKQYIDEMMAGLDHVVVTGHSLGGGLANRLAAQYGDKVDGVYTYQAPGVSTAVPGDPTSMDEARMMQEGFNRREGTQAWHMVNQGDVVHRVGNEIAGGDRAHYIVSDSGHNRAMPELNEAADHIESGMGGLQEARDNMSWDPRTWLQSAQRARAAVADLRASVDDFKAAGADIGSAHTDHMFFDPNVFSGNARPGSDDSHVVQNTRGDAIHGERQNWESARRNAGGVFAAKELYERLRDFGESPPDGFMEWLQEANEIMQQLREADWAEFRRGLGELLEQGQDLIGHERQ